MRILFGAILYLLAANLCMHAQAVDSGVAWERDYTFERMVATRTVNDKEDKGKITLVAYVYRPVKNDRREVVLFSHGSTGGLATSPKEPMGGPPMPVINFFVARGYTLVAPMRRGRNESTGTYVEECSAFTGQCTTAEQVALGERGIREALADTNAVIDQIVLRRLVPRESKIIAGGISRGGFLSLMLAGERPKLVKGVVNLVGGWYGVTERLTAAENDQRMADHKIRLERAARATQVPSVWLYAARDPLYKDGVAADLHRYWTNAGGKGEFVYFSEHSLLTGHQVATNVALWGKHVDALLKTIDPAKP
jgi:pimeloyl-ACP methyl ester carboxylesterase